MRILAALFLSTLLVFSSCAASSRIEQVQPLTTAGGEVFCSSWSLNQKQHLYVTAAHCLDETIPGIPTAYMYSMRIVKLASSKPLDIAVFKAAHGVKQLPLADHAPEHGEMVAVIGYPEGSTYPVVFAGMFFSDAIGKDEEKNIRFISLFTMSAKEGDSGGPIVNAEGKVVSIAQLKFDNEKLTGGIPFEPMKQFLKPYLP